MLLRHAKTERPRQNTPDYNRKLTKRGRNDARAVATYMVQYGLVPDQVIVSPARRAQETWSVLARTFGEGPKVVVDERIYDASAEQVVDVICKAPVTRSLLVVGHNPSLHDLSVQLIRSGDIELREQISENLPTSGLVVIDLPIENWSLLRPHPQAGPLQRFASPRLIAKTS
jgi:phosphohistidine phosphatase